MVRRGFTTARVRELNELIEATVKDLIDALPMGVEVDELDHPGIAPAGHPPNLTVRAVRSLPVVLHPPVAT